MSTDKSNILEQIKTIDFNHLPISEYNKMYISNLKSALDYYFDIYRQTILKAIAMQKKPKEELTLVDYGAGSGFSSLLAKEMGLGQVIYIDLNPHSVQTIKTLKSILGIGPDIILEGDSKTLKKFCLENKKTEPEIIIGLDVIEHIYDLNSFFSDVSTINPHITMVFTTASNIKNTLKSKRLYDIMDECEKGTTEDSNYLQQRFGYISKKHPELPIDQQIKLSNLSRGMTFEDIDAFIDKCLSEKDDTKWQSKESNPHNTCDPATGNYAERMLSFEEYKELGALFNFGLEISAGGYNEYRKNILTKAICKVINRIIANHQTTGFKVAPYIVLTYSCKTM